MFWLIIKVIYIYDIYIKKKTKNKKIKQNKTKNLCYFIKINLL